MEFRISDTFTDSLGKLTGDEQKAVKTTAFDLQVNPANPGMQFHKLDRAKDSRFWSVRVNRDIRLIVHKSEGNLLLCYVDHHDKAYAWAEKRKLETHPRTGAAQFVEIRETVKEIAVPTYVEAKPTPTEKKKLFSEYDDEQLLAYGVPQEWLLDVRLADEDSLFEVAEHLPKEAAEALLELATGGNPEAIRTATNIAPFEHPDAQRRFKLVANAEELQQALDYPWEKWTVFLHPTQKEIVDKQFNGPARVSGSAGTGKTVVAIHRAAWLLRRYPSSKVLLTTFSTPLANALRMKLNILIGNQEKELSRISVVSIEKAACDLYEAQIGELKIVSAEVLKEILRESSLKAETNRFSEQFLWTEWNEIVDAWQISTWEEYRTVPRLGRKTRLVESQRMLLWNIFQEANNELVSRNLLTRSSMFAKVQQSLTQSQDRPFEYVIVDESQDIGVPELRFLASLSTGDGNSLFFAGDLGQRIFQPPFSWKGLGVDVRGRSKTLRVNYRTSHQIRSQADRLLPPKISDVDGNTESRKGVISAFEGPKPTVVVCKSMEEEKYAAVKWIQSLQGSGVTAREIGVFVRSEMQFERARSVIEEAGLQSATLDEQIKTVDDRVSIMTMHLAKGLEFRAVLVLGCDDEVIPLQERVNSVADDSDLEEVYNTERHLLYVACTRARDFLMVSGVEPASEFLDDLVID